ncbi:hypothetical protein D3C76_1001650 [compost metagenome]
MYHHLDLADGRLDRRELGLYLAGLDAIAPQLDLLIQPTQVVDVAITALEGPVPGAIEAMCTTGVSQLDEGLGGAFRQVEVAAGQS